MEFIDMARADGADAALYAFLAMGVFVSAVLVFMMQPGFLLLEAGSISRMNAITDIYKNALDFAVGGLAFWLFGYGVLIGESPLTPYLQAAFGTTDIEAGAPRIGPPESLIFLFQLGFATTAATICSGAVTARITPRLYLAFAAVFTAVIYPTAAWAVWTPGGPLYGAFNDFAGGVVVHSVGAAAGLAGTLLLGPRLGFNGYDPIGLGPSRLVRIAKRHAPHNMPLAALGVFLLWLGWFGFNGGTALAGGVAPGRDAAPALAETAALFGDVLVATVLAAASAAATTALIHAVARRDLDLMRTLNSVIAGLVAVTAVADQCDPTEAAGLGVVGALVFLATRSAMERLTVDDPVSAIAAHGFTGVLSAAAYGVVGPEIDLSLAGAQAATAALLAGAVFAASVASFLVIAAIAAVGAVLFRRTPVRDAFRRGGLRIDYRTEIYGIDVELHGQDAYGAGAADR